MGNTKVVTQYPCFTATLAFTTILCFFLYHHLRLSPIDDVYDQTRRSPSLPSPPASEVVSPPPESTNDEGGHVRYEQTEIKKKKKKKKRSGVNVEIGKMERSLSEARAAIREAGRTTNYTTPFGVEGVSFLPLPRLYRNSYAFYRSHTEMMKRFKVWTYKEGEPPLFHQGPTRSIYGIEGQFMDEMEGGMSNFMASNPNQAHAFFLPLSLLKVRQFLLETYSRAPMHRVALDYIHLLSDRYPFWNRTLGADHFLLSCHDWAPDVSKADPDLLKYLMRALCNANVTEGFHPVRDVSIPEINVPGGDALGPPTHLTRTSRRKILAFFAGGRHGYVRDLLFDAWKDGGADAEIRVHEHLPAGEDYSRLMGGSRFCLCPSGYEVASPRIVEALHAECVPVIISDGYSLPFSDVLEWRQFSVEIKVSEIPEIGRILRGISERKYMRLVEGVRRVKWHFTLNRPAKPFDMIHMVLHSVWLRRLNIKLALL